MDTSQQIKQNTHYVDKFYKYYYPFEFIIDLHKYILLLSVGFLGVAYYMEMLEDKEFKILLFGIMLCLFVYLFGLVAATSNDPEGFWIFELLVSVLAAVDGYAVYLYRDPVSHWGVKLRKNFGIVIYLIALSGLMKLVLIFCGEKMRRCEKKLQKTQIARRKLM